MNRIDCENEKNYKRSIGLALLPLAVALGLIGSMSLPAVWGSVSMLLLTLAVVFLVAPESKACKTLRRPEK
jgi:hypothetical protein